MDFLYLFILSFLAWVFAKLDDATNEHGLKFFKTDNFVFAILWGILVWILITYDKAIFATFLGLMFYGIYRLKFDFKSHAIALIILLIMALNSNFWNTYFDLFFISLLYLFFDILKRNFKIKFFALNIHFILIPFIYMLYSQNIYSLIILATILWKYVVNYFFKIK